jgi:ATP-dependent DNA helicase RecG
MQFMTPDLAQTLGTRETTALEFKESAVSRDRIAEVICAFANDLACTGGGDVLIGVADDGRPSGGVDTSDRELLRLTELRDDGRILDRPSMTVAVASYQGESVIRISVEASSAPPVRFNGVIWVRPGPTTRRGNREDERILNERRRSLDGPFDSRPVPSSSLAAMDLEVVRSNYLPAVVDPDVIAENQRSLEQQLASVRLTDPTGVPTVLGLLIAGFDPGDYIPGAYIQFVRYQGEDLGAAVADDQEIRAHLINASIRLEAVLRANLRTKLVQVTDFREASSPDYPIEALREACMNAIMHRNYETSYAPMRISWFEDRVEISNPGGPFGQVRQDNFDRVNDYRNPSLAAAMKSLGYVNRFGRGIGRIRAVLERNGNPPADFLVDDSSWTVILRSNS